MNISIFSLGYVGYVSYVSLGYLANNVRPKLELIDTNLLN
jgi:UDP-glucose 6-dehydrogenase